jgi:hypothetical protein
MDLKKELGEVANAVSKIMDEALKGSQHKIDANKNNKIDAHDFKLLRAKKEVKEESEQIDELSKKTLGNYITRNADDQARIGFINSAAHHDKTTDSKTKNKILDKNERQGINRDIGLTRAVNKLTKEDQDFINELNKSTLGSYVNASARDAVHRTAQEVETGRLDKMADKRMKGIKLATKKLAKEETDQVEEGYYKDIDTNRKEDERLAAQKKKQAPFTPDKPKAKVATPGKFGYGYSAARHLARQGMAGVTKEEAEQVEEDIQKTSTGYIHHARPGVYGGSAKEKHVVDTLRGPKKSEIEAIEKEKKMKKSFSEMLDLINTHGLKALSEMIKEEPDNEQFTQELKDQEAKAAGKKKQADIAKGAVQAVKVEEDVEQIDEISKDTLRSYVGKAEDDLLKKHKAVSNTPGSSPSLKYARQMDMYKRMDNITKAQKKITKEDVEQVEERSLTEPEMKKKEEIVKSMKKGLSGFKSRYGDRAKEVMYATATARAKGE